MEGPEGQAGLAGLVLEAEVDPSSQQQKQPSELQLLHEPEWLPEHHSEEPWLPTPDPLEHPGRPNRNRQGVVESPSHREASYPDRAE